MGPRALVAALSAGLAVAALAHLSTALRPSPMPAAGFPQGERIGDPAPRVRPPMPVGQAPAMDAARRPLRYLYRWRGEGGGLHVSTDAPGVEIPWVERIPLRATADGVLDSGAPVALGRGADLGEGPRLPDLGRAPMAVYTADGFQALVRQAHQVQTQLDQRRRLLEHLTEHL